MTRPGAVERVVIAELARVLPPSDPRAMEKGLGPRDAATARVAAASVQLGQAMDALFAEMARGR